MTPTRETMIEGLVDALKDRQGQLEIELKDLELELINAKVGVRLSGTMTLMVHVREMDERERKANVDARISHLHGQT